MGEKVMYPLKPLSEFDPEVAEYYQPISHLIDSLIRYVNKKVPTGGFLRAALENNFVETVGHADLQNKRNLDKLASFIYMYVPMEAWGGKAKVADWLGETRGRDNREGLR